MSELFPPQPLTAQRLARTIRGLRLIPGLLILLPHLILVQRDFTVERCAYFRCKVEPVVTDQLTDDRRPDRLGVLPEQGGQRVVDDRALAPLFELALQVFDLARRSSLSRICASSVVSFLGAFGSLAGTLCAASNRR